MKKGWPFLLLVTVITLAPQSFAADTTVSVDEQIDRSTKQKKIPWQAFPALKLRKIHDKNKGRLIKPKLGESLVAVFLASWCIPCQNLIGPIKKIQEKHEKSFAQFVYIFTHDTAEDAEGFVKTHMIENGYLASQELLEAFHQPPLPSIYIADRQSWMVMRKLDLDEKDLLEIDRFLTIHNAM